MTDPAPIFRAEALRSRTGPSSPSSSSSSSSQPRPRAAAWMGPRHRAGEAQTGPWWVTGAYWILLALLVGGLAAGTLIRVGSQPLIVALVAGLTSDAAGG